MVTMLMAVMMMQDAPAWKRLMEQAEQLAASEPPVLGVDTRIRLGGVLAAKQPGEARRVLGEAESLVYTFTDERTRAVLLDEIHGVLEKFDKEEAGRLRAALPYAAYSSKVLGRHLKETAKRRPGEAPAEFALLLDAFPAKPSEEAAERLKFAIEDMGALAPELVAVGRKKLAEAKVTPRKKKEKPKDPDAPAVDGLDSMEVVALARKQAPVVGLGMLLTLIDKDKEMAVERRLALAGEALELAGKLEVGDDRLVVESMLTRRIFQYGDARKAGAAAEQMAATFFKLYECEGAACTKIVLDDNPGDTVNLFAEYLREHNIAAQALGLSYASLDARLLLFDLEEVMVGEKRKFKLF